MAQSALRRFFQEFTKAGRGSTSCHLLKSCQFYNGALPTVFLSSSTTQHAFFSLSANMSKSEESEQKKKSTVKQAPESAEDVSVSANPTARYATRGNILTEQHNDVKKKRDEFLSMDIAKKRKLYSCKKKYVELKDVETWPEYFSNELANGDNSKNWWKANKKNIAAEIKNDVNVKMSIFRGDITTLEIDAIVNAANESLLGGGGVDGAIHRAAGITLKQECELLCGCRAGDAKISCGYKLPAKYVIHTVGPRGERPEVLESCYKKCLELVKENQLKTVAFPCISTGVFGYPNLNAAKVVLKTVREWLDTDDYAPKIERILFCLFLDVDVDIYGEEMQLFFPLERE